MDTLIMLNLWLETVRARLEVPDMMQGDTQKFIDEITQLELKVNTLAAQVQIMDPETTTPEQFKQIAGSIQLIWKKSAIVTKVAFYSASRKKMDIVLKFFTRQFQLLQTTTVDLEVSGKNTGMTKEYLANYRSKLSDVFTEKAKAMQLYNDAMTLRESNEPKQYKIAVLKLKMAKGHFKKAQLGMRDLAGALSMTLKELKKVDGANELWKTNAKKMNLLAKTENDKADLLAKIKENRKKKGKPSGLSDNTGITAKIVEDVKDVFN